MLGPAMQSAGALALSPREHSGKLVALDPRLFQGPLAGERGHNLVLGMPGVDSRTRSPCARTC